MEHINGNKNPNLDTSLYTVEFADSVEVGYSFKIIADKMGGNCYHKGNQLKMVY